jgi:hypothetical protein
MSFKCDIHGTIRGRGTPKFCPACGTECRVVKLFPLLNLYVYKNDLRNSIQILLAVTVVSAAIYGIRGCCKSDDAEEVIKKQITQDKVNSLPPAWKQFYDVLGSMNYEVDFERATTSFVESHPVGSIPALPGNCVQLIREKYVWMGFDNQQKTFSLLFPYFASSSTKPDDIK